jgi:predicted transposase/invertase (TIGR01784 family)
MQMFWTDSFKTRVLFNAYKVYVRQSGKGTEFKSLQPVYALSIVNEIFERETTVWYHHYQLVHTEDRLKIIDGLQLIFIELPKFEAKTYTDKKLTALWLRYLSEIKNGQEMIDEELLKEFKKVPEIEKALELTKESAYTTAELEAYDRYWDAISVEKSIRSDAHIAGREEGIQIGEANATKREKNSTALILKKQGILTFKQISEATGLTESEIQNL